MGEQRQVGEVVQAETAGAAPAVVGAAILERAAEALETTPEHLEPETIEARIDGRGGRE